MRKISRILALSMALVGLFALSANAIPIFDFVVVPPDPAGAFVQYTGGATAFTGSLLNVAAVVVTGANTNNGTFALAGGTLSFTTGTFTGSDPLHWNFGPGGTITLHGTIPAFGPADVNLVGTWGNSLIAQANTSDTFHTLVGGFNDTKSPDFLAEFGEPNPGLMFGNINFSFTTAAALTPPAAIPKTGPPPATGSLGSGDVTDNKPIPVPPSAILLGTGLLGLVGLRFRRK